MADTEVIKVLFEIANPQVLSKLEGLSKSALNIQFNTNLDSKLQEILSLRDKQINIKFGVDNATLNTLQDKLNELNKPINVKINVEDNLDDIIAKLQRAEVLSKRINAVGATRGEIDTLSQDPLLNQARGTFAPGGKQPSVAQVQSQADILRDVKQKSQIQALELRLQQMSNIQTGKGFTPLKPGDISAYTTGLANNSIIEQDKIRNAEKDRIARLQNTNIDQFRRSTAPFSDINQGKLAQAQRDRELADFNQTASQLAGGLGSKYSKIDSARQSQLDRELSDFNKESTKLSSALGSKYAKLSQEKQNQLDRELADFNKASSELARGLGSKFSKAESAKQSQLNQERRDFFSEIQPGISRVNSRFTREDTAREAALRDYQQAIAPSSSLAGRETFLRNQKQVEIDKDNAIDKYRRSVAPVSSLADRAKQLEDERREEARAVKEAATRRIEASAARKELFRDTALGAIRGQGPLALGGSVLGGLAGGAFAGPAGVAIGSTFGGAVGEATQKSLEGVVHALENVTDAGLEFQKTIVALSGILQANTRVIGEDGKELGAVETSQFNTNRAREIQKAARSELLPLGIGGESEAQLVGGLISGFSQRGIILSPEETKTVSRRFGSAIVALAPQLLGNAVQIRRDSEDIAAGSPNAGRTTLGVALKNIAPDLFRTLASGQDVIKATERLEQFNKAIKNSDQASVQVLRLSGAIDKLRTTAGDALLQGLAPGLKSLADAFSNDGLSDGFEGLFKQLGSLGSVLINLGILVGKAVAEIAKSIPILGPIIQNLKNFVDQASGGPSGTSIPNPEDVIKKYLTELGVEPKGIDREAVTNANFRLNKLSEAEFKAGISGPEIQERFLSDILNEKIKALGTRSAERSGTFDTETFAGRKDLAEFQGNIAKEKFDTAQQGFDFYSKSAANAKDPAQAAIFEAVADNFKNAMDTAAVDIKKASNEVTRAGLDETKTLQGLRNAQEGLVQVQREQILQTNDLNRSLQEANDNVAMFATKVQQAFASEEENIIQASLDAQKLGVETPFAFTDDDLLNAKRNSAGAKLNGLLGDAGLRGTQAGTNESTGVNLPRTGTPFTNRLDAEEGKLADAVTSITNQLEILPRVLRDALENLKDLVERTKLQFPGGIPNLPGVPGGVLSPGLGGAVGGGNLGTGNNPLGQGRAPSPAGGGSSGGGSLNSEDDDDYIMYNGKRVLPQDIPEFRKLGARDKEKFIEKYKLNGRSGLAGRKRDAGNGLSLPDPRDLISPSPSHDLIEKIMEESMDIPLFSPRPSETDDFLPDMEDRVDTPNYYLPSVYQDGMPLQSGLTKEEVMPNYQAELDINGNQNIDYYDKKGNLMPGPMAASRDVSPQVSPSVRAMDRFGKMIEGTPFDNMFLQADNTLDMNGNQTSPVYNKDGMRTNGFMDKPLVMQEGIFDYSGEPLVEGKPQGIFDIPNGGAVSAPGKLSSSRPNRIGGALLAAASDTAFTGGDVKNVSPAMKSFGEGLLGASLDGSGNGRIGNVQASKFGSFGGGLLATSEKAGEVNKTSSQDVVEAIKEGTRLLQEFKNSLEGTIRKGIDF